MKSIRCLLSYATRCEHFKSGECMSPVKCKYQMELISVKFPEAIFMPTKEAWEKMQAEIVRLTAENAELRARLISPNIAQRFMSLHCIIRQYRTQNIKKQLRELKRNWIKNDNYEGINDTSTIV